MAFISLETVFDPIGVVGVTITQGKQVVGETDARFTQDIYSDNNELAEETRIM